MSEDTLKIISNEAQRTAEKGNEEHFKKMGLGAHFLSSSCEGELCSICFLPASHKVGEEIPSDDPHPNRHNLTAYVCCGHFKMIFGDTVPCGKKVN